MPSSSSREVVSIVNYPQTYETHPCATSQESHPGRRWGGGEGGRVYLQVIGGEKQTQWLFEGEKLDAVEGIAFLPPILQRNFLVVSGPPIKKLVLAM